MLNRIRSARNTADSKKMRVCSSASIVADPVFCTPLFLFYENLLLICLLFFTLKSKIKVHRVKCQLFVDDGKCSA